MPHPANRLDQVTVSRGATGPSSRFSPPVEPESDLMPANNRLRPDDHQSPRPPGPHRAENCPEQPIGVAKGRWLGRAVQHHQLVPQGEVLQHQVAMGVKPPARLRSTARTSESMALQRAPIQPTINEFPCGWTFCYPQVGVTVTDFAQRFGTRLLPRTAMKFHSARSPRRRFDSR